MEERHVLLASGNVGRSISVLETRGLGDRLLAGEAIDGVLFAHHDTVSIVEGPHSGGIGSIVLLMGIRPQPTYLVEMGSGRGNVRVRQSELRATD
jgi:hypothetical protein